jgi:hypothetical protein
MYQCPGCVNGPAPSCYKKDSVGSGCSKHGPGTFMEGVGKILLGMEKGFNRVGPIGWPYLGIYIFETPEQLLGDTSPQSLSTSFKNNGLYDNFNVPVWMYLDEHGNTIVRGLRPRINTPFLNVLLWDARENIHCFEITKAIIDSMD